MQKNHPPYLAVRQVASHFPESAPETAAVRHSERPAKFHLLNIASDKLAILVRQLFDLIHSMTGGLRPGDS
jgi:hypothetical protein